MKDPSRQSEPLGKSSRMMDQEGHSKQGKGRVYTGDEAEGQDPEGTVSSRLVVSKFLETMCLASQ